MDRIDLHVSVKRPEYKEIDIGKSKNGISSAQLREGVENAIAIQKERYADEGIKFNSRLDTKLLEKYCVPDEKGKKVLKAAFEKWHLSARSYHRMLKLARTAADLDGSAEIKERHILEIINYRLPDELFGDKF
jgi:magnesium chelatase family protein